MQFAFFAAVFFAFQFSPINKVFAATLTESFDTDTQRASPTTTAVWNHELGHVHPTLLVSGLQAPAQAATSQTVVVSDGSDGPFDNTTYANFGTVVGFLITVDATVHPVLKVTRFQLDNLYTLTAINGPLVIHSLSTVDISGLIDCSGENGLPAFTVSGGVGGSGKCGGFSGGNGGNSSASGDGGLPLAGLVSGGGGGVYGATANGAGGGGGGAYAGNPGSPGINSAPAGSNGGTAGNGAGAANFEFTDLSGSPGGGGGSGSATEGGSGGGGGGGTVVIHAVGNVSISATGFILALGGDGGASNTGGGGGGGGGGGVKIITAANLHLDSGVPINVTGGSGAIPTTGGAGDGGSGSLGRTWSNYITFSGIGSESVGSGLLQLGSVEYSRVLEVAETITFDTASTLPIFSSIVSNPANADITLEVAGSTDNFAVDDSGWLPAASIATLNNKRYVKFRLNLTNSNATAPTVVNDVTITYTLGSPPAPPPGPSPAADVLKDNFQFQSGCGRLESTDGNFFQFSLLLLLAPFLLAVFFRCRQNTFPKI